MAKIVTWNSGDGIVCFDTSHVNTGQQVVDSIRKWSNDPFNALVYTHGHADHIAGLAGAVRGRKVGATWFGNVKRGHSAQIGDTKIKVLWPDNGEYDPNNSSIAVRIDTPDFSLFAGGDMEPLTQSVIAGTMRAVDIYTVCHHGSAYQDQLFTRALSPQVAMISVGAGNSYGHPAPATLELLAQAGAKVLRTDRDGAIAISARNHRLKVRTSKSKLTFLRGEWLTDKELR